MDPPSRFDQLRQTNLVHLPAVAGIVVFSNEELASDFQDRKWSDTEMGSLRAGAVSLESELYDSGESDGSALGRLEPRKGEVYTLGQGMRLRPLSERAAM